MVEFTAASPSNIPAIAALYQNAFPEALQAVFGKPRIPSVVVEDAFQLLHACEPAGFFLARESGQLAGFMVVSSDLRRLHGSMATRLPGWLIRAVTGRYRGIGLQFLPRLWRAWRDYRLPQRPPWPQPMGQILSIAVEQTFRGRGIGKNLSTRALQYLEGTPARSVRLEVDAAKTVPLALYRELGFADEATIPSPRGPARVMRLTLKRDSGCF